MAAKWVCSALQVAILLQQDYSSISVNGTDVLTGLDAHGMHDVMTHHDVIMHMHITAS